MPVKEIVEDRKKYTGQYVAKESFKSLKVVSFGSDPLEVWKDAEEKGVKDPVVFYIPSSKLVHIY